MEVQNRSEITGLSKTNLHGEVLNSEIRINGYLFERSDRQTGLSSGVACYTPQEKKITVKVQIKSNSCTKFYHVRS